MSRAAVENRRLIYVSPSQITKFAPEHEGCNRRWWFRYVQRIPESETENQKLGTELHRHNEMWLRYKSEARPVDVQGKAFEGAALRRFWKAQDLFRAGKHMLPLPSDKLLIESPMKGVTAAGIEVVGKIDLIAPQSDVESDPPGTMRLDDHKTTSSIARYAKTAAQLPLNFQMLAYQTHIAENFEGVRNVRIGHNNYQTKGHAETERVSTLVDLQTVKTVWHSEADPIVEKMKSVAGVGSLDDVAANRSVCEAFSGCPYKDRCPTKPGARRFIVGILDKLNASLAVPAAKPPEEVLAKKLVIEDKSTEAPKLAPGVKPALLSPNGAKITPAALGPNGYFYDEAQQQYFKVDALGNPVVVGPAILPPDAPKSDPELAAECPNCPGKQHKRVDCPVLKTAEAAKTEVSDIPKKRGRPPKPKVETEGTPLNGVEVIPSTREAPPVSVSTAQVTAVQTPPPSEVATGGFSLFINCTPLKGRAALSLDSYINERAEALAKQEDVPDIRCAGDKSIFAFGKWKGYLAALCRESPPSSGPWVVFEGSEFATVVIEALSPLAMEVIRGR